MGLFGNGKPGGNSAADNAEIQRRQDAWARALDTHSLPDFVHDRLKAASTMSGPAEPAARVSSGSIPATIPMTMANSFREAAARPPSAATEIWKTLEKRAARASATSGSDFRR